MISKYVVLLLLLNIYSYGQQRLNIMNEARYELSFREYNNQKPQYIVNNFILLYNNSESHFKNMNIYVKDSLLDAKKIKETGDLQRDLITFSKFSTELPFNVHRKGNQITFSNEVPFAGELRYIETVDFKWKITKETKEINGVKCIKATAAKWGRNWIAYYSPKHQMPFGPYKFYDLPGLIFEVSDDNKDYTFKLYRFKNRKKDNFLLHNYPKAKKVTKKQYNVLRHNAALKPSNIKVEGYPDINKKIDKQRAEEEKNYNPIELTE